jgi:isocitrate lyase
LNLSMFELAREYSRSGMLAYAQLQQREFSEAERDSYKAVKHQRFVGTGYFDQLNTLISAGESSTCALAGSTEAAQFENSHDSRFDLREGPFEDPYDHELPGEHRAWA